MDVEATIMFTDCKGFTAMSEELKDPRKISETLIAYFTETSQHVLSNEGTIIKYIGDAVMAAWNAPLRQADHALKGAMAAYQLHEASKIAVMGRTLTTRVGLATGEVLAGNLGSPYRFDYTCIGETTNFAARLESLNKQLGTDILISDSTAKAIREQFVLRGLGHFVVAGKTQGVAIHELIGPLALKKEDLEWAEKFTAAIAEIRQGAFDKAKELFREVVWQRDGTDGPSEFSIKKIAELEKTGQLSEWTGMVRLTEK